MDQIQRDKIAAKLKKIKALAERGVGGEKETAMRMYEDLKARYELEDEEIMLDAVTLHWFGYADELEERVLRWIFYKVTGDASYHIYTGKYSRRKKRGCDCTEIEAAEITLLYNFYKEELKREAWKMFNMYRDWLATDFCQPVYEEWLTEAVAKGRIKAPGFFTDPVIRKAYCGAKWNGPAKGMLDPVKEVTAAEKRVQNGFSTRSDETMQMTGTSYYNNIEQLKHEEKELREVKKIANANANKPKSPAAAAGAGNEPAAGQQDAGQSIRSDDK